MGYNKHYGNNLEDLVLTVATVNNNISTQYITDLAIYVYTPTNAIPGWVQYNQHQLMYINRDHNLTGECSI